MNEIKRKAATSKSEHGRNIVADVTRTMNYESVAAMPEPHNILRTIRRVRYNKDFPVVPSKLTDLVIPYELKNIDNEPFLLYDSESVDNRFLMFSSKKNLEMLKRAKIWYMDGTFDIVPELFEQMYTIVGKYIK